MAIIYLCSALPCLSFLTIWWTSILCLQKSSPLSQTILHESLSKQALPGLQSPTTQPWPSCLLQILVLCMIHHQCYELFSLSLYDTIWHNWHLRGLACTTCTRVSSRTGFHSTMTCSIPPWCALLHHDLFRSTMTHSPYNDVVPLLSRI